MEIDMTDTANTHEDITLESSHDSQVPEGAVILQVKRSEGQFVSAKWSIEPTGGVFANAEKHETELSEKDFAKKVIWTAPKIAGTYVVMATITLNPEDIKSRRRSSSKTKALDADNTETSEPNDSSVPIILRHQIEITPMALPLNVVSKINEGVEALKQGLAGEDIKLEPQYPNLTPEKALWAIIRNRCDAIGFNHYKTFIDAVMCGKDPEGSNETLNGSVRDLRYRGTDAYEILKKATEAFLMHETGLKHENLHFKDGREERNRLPQLEGHSDEDAIQDLEKNRESYLQNLENESRTFPYFMTIRKNLGHLPLKPAEIENEECYGILRSRIAPPTLLELIWSYWHEEGMLVQTLKLLSLRFQNKTTGKKRGGRDALASMNLDPLRPLGNIFWGYVQDEQHRLTLARRAYEYDHHYGFSIEGSAVPVLEAADSRIGFLQAFHTLLHRVSIFFKEQSDTTKVPDGYPLLNGLKECHLLLAQGAHNQYGDLPWTARQEMLIEKWLLARPETSEFLGRRTMVPYHEEWMPAVDQMRDLMGWKGATVRHFRDLATYGEMILLSIRFGNWSDEINQDIAKVWAQYWRQELQAYINAYKAVTTVDLSADADMANQKLMEKRMTSPAALLRDQARIHVPAE